MILKQLAQLNSPVFISVGGPPPEKTIVLASVIAPRTGMKSQTREQDDEVSSMESFINHLQAFGFEAREFLRKLLVGNVVQFAVEYEDRERSHGTIVFEGENMGVAIVRQGLAKVRNSRPPLCAKNIDGGLA